MDALHNDRCFCMMRIAHKNEHRVICYHRNRHEVFMPNCRANGHCPGRGTEQGVAVGSGFRDRVGTAARPKSNNDPDRAVRIVDLLARGAIGHAAALSAKVRNSRRLMRQLLVPPGTTVLAARISWKGSDQRQAPKWNSHLIMFGARPLRVVEE